MVTKYRRKVFTKKIISDLETIFSNVCQRFQAELVECDGENNHVHLLINSPPTYTVSRLVNSLKGVSSRLIRKASYATIQQALWGKNLWSPSYFAGTCGGASLDVIKQYIESQQTPC